MPTFFWEQTRRIEKYTLSPNSKVADILIVDRGVPMSQRDKESKGLCKQVCDWMLQPLCKSAMMEGKGRTRSEKEFITRCPLCSLPGQYSIL